MAESIDFAEVLAKALEQYQLWQIEPDQIREQLVHSQEHWRELKSDIDSQSEEFRSHHRALIVELTAEAKKIRAKFEQQRKANAAKRVDEVIAIIHRAIEYYRNYQVPKEQVQNAFDQFLVHWDDVKKTVWAQPAEWQTFHMDLTNEVSVQSQALRVKFEAALEEEMLADEDNASAHSEQRPIAMDIEPSKAIKQQVPPMSSANSPLTKDTVKARLSNKELNEQAPVVTQSQLSGAIEKAISAPATHKYSYATLQGINTVLATLAKIPRMPARAQQKDINIIQQHLKWATERCKVLQLDINQYSPWILAQATLAFNEPTRMLWKYVLTKEGPANLAILMAFLFNQEEVIMSGYNPFDDEQEACGSGLQTQTTATGTIPKRFKSGTTRAVVPPRAVAPSRKITSCPCCGENHPLYRCKRFLSKSFGLRLEFVREAKICPNCMKEYHSGDACPHPGCSVCELPHNSVLCQRHHL